MQQSWRSLFLITLPLAILGSLGSINLVRAQITPDNTLGAGNSVVNHNVDVGKGIPSDQIEGGARRGANLFHSFQEFNIEAGRGAYFSNPNGVANIITRVTGGNGSDIQGTLGVLGNANLFFINPNGINFGKNARLDLSGSFLASTANSLVFENGLEFSATNPQAPPLLAVNIPIGLRFRDNPGKITVKGSGQNLWLNGAFSSFDNPTLAVQAGQNLTLVGGNVSLGGKASSDVVDGGVLQAPGGRVELGGLTAAGVVNLNTDGSLSFPDGVARADVSLTNQAGINVIAGQQGGGSININARNIKISGESLLTARIAGGLGTVNTQAGDIKLNATGETRIDQSRIENIVNLQATAKRSGNINITTSNLSLTNGAQLDTSTFGTGDAGNVTIQASDTVSVSGGAQVLARNAGGTGDAGSIKITAKDKVCIAGFQNNGDATVATDVASGGKGNGNSLTINAPQVEIKDEAIVTASIINGKGKDGGLAQAGDVNINATQKVSIDNSQVFSEVGNSNYSRGNGGSIIIEAPSVSLDHGASLTTRIRLLSEGNGGNIKIKTGSLSLKNGSKLVTSTSAQGNAGNVTIQASNSVSFDGVSKQENRFLDLNDISGGKLSSGVFSIVQAGATGHGGNIEINTGTLSVSGGAQVLARNAGGTGDAGSIKITAADKVSIAGFQNNGDATVGTDVVHGGKGNGNSLTINAPQVEIKDQSKISASTSSTGDAGNVTINTRELLAQDGAQVNASTSGAGAGGSLTVNGVNGQGSKADSVQLIGTTPDGKGPSGLFVSADLNATKGAAGNVTINTRELLVQGGARVSAVTSDAANGGRVTVDADSVKLENGAQINADTNGAGHGGNLLIKADSVKLINPSPNSQQSKISASTSSTGDAGNVTINTRELLAQDGAVNARTSGAGHGGDLLIKADSVKLINPNPNSQQSKISASTSSTGDAGNVTINTRELLAQDGAQVNAGTSGAGAGGSLTVNGVNGPGSKADSVQLIGTTPDGLMSSGLFVAADPGATRGAAGDVTINTRELLVQGGARVSAVTSDAANGGRVTVDADSVKLENGAQINADTNGAGHGGNLLIKADSVKLINPSPNSQQSKISASTSSTGDAGNVTINTRELLAQDGAVNARTSGAGHGGDLLIKADSVKLINPSPNSQQSKISASTSSTGDAGNVTINTRELLAQDGAQVNASTSGAGAGGSLTVNGVNGPGSKADSVQLIGTTPDGLMSSGLFVAADPGATRGAAGDVTINTRELLVQGGARVSAVTSGAANGGRVTVDADSVKLISANKFGTIPSDLSTKSESGAQGTPGPLTINTRELLVQDGAQVNASTTGQGNGGEVMINANTLEIKGGGQILTTASNSGKAGDITVNASDRIILENANSSILANTTSSSTGDGGKITIKPQPNQLKFPDITIADGAQVAVDNQGTGKGGEISIQANTLTLDRGKLTASAIKDGGNIMLNLPNYLLLRHNSQISANTNSQTGGNIKIDTPFIVSFPSKNSINSITANATTGEGGKITINAGLFGIAPLTQQEIDSLRSQSSKPPTQSYIAAYSEKSQNLSGNVTVNSPDTDPSRTIVQLPQTVVDPVNKIAQNPCQQGTGSAFIITGRGGLPSNPNQALTSDNVRVDLLTPVSSRDAINRVSTVKPSTTSTVKQIVPAQGWVFNDKGQVVLTAYDPTNTGSQRPWRTPASCAKR